MKVKTFIINLEKSAIRRQYMQDLLSPYPFLDVVFVKAIDGRLLSEEERSSRFDYAKSKKVYGRSLNAGEVGCALSHRKVYELLLENTEPYALVLEDDIAIQKDLNLLPLDKIDKIITTAINSVSVKPLWEKIFLCIVRPPCIICSFIISFFDNFATFLQII